MRREEDIRYISRCLSYLRAEVETLNSMNLTDINVHAENFFRDLLNLIYGYKLRNINIDEMNTAAIDLGDTSKKIALQVTSTNALKKTTDTVSKFIAKGLQNTYDRLIILNIRSKSEHREETIGENGVFTLNTRNDIWDKDDIVRHVTDLPTEKIAEIANFLRKEMVFSSGVKIANEVQTLFALIELISDEGHPEIGKAYSEDPDPEGKIERRFFAYAAKLKDEFTDNFAEYGAVLKSVLESASVTQIQFRRLGNYLKRKSIDLLDQCAGDAITALNRLVAEFLHLLANEGVEHDEGAVRFFIVDQIIRCNVFPNKAEAQ